MSRRHFSGSSRRAAAAAAAAENRLNQRNSRTLSSVVSRLPFTRRTFAAATNCFACCAILFGFSQNVRIRSRRRIGAQPNIVRLLVFLCAIPSSAAVYSPDDVPTFSDHLSTGTSVHGDGSSSSSSSSSSSKYYDSSATTAQPFHQSTDLMLGVDCRTADCLRHCCAMREHLKSMRSRRCEPINAMAANQLMAVRWLQYHPNFVVLDDESCRQHRSHNKRRDDDDDDDDEDVTAVNDWNAVADICYDFLVRGRRFQPHVCEFDGSKFYQFYHREKCNVSTTFLVLTLALYVATPKLRRKVHDKCFLCYLAFFILGCLAACSMYFVADEYYVALPGYFMHFGMLSSYFWLNVMCIDMLRSINAVKSVHQSSDRPFMIYTLYAVGCSLVLSVITFIADYFLPPECSLRPGIIKTGRLIDLDQSFSWLNPSFIYFHIFVYVTFAINTYAFVRTASRITKENKRWGRNKDEGSRRHKKQQTRCLLYLKLFILMGLNNVGNPMTYYWHATRPIRFLLDAVTELHGIFIFILFVCNKRVLSLLRKRFFPGLWLSDAAAMVAQPQKDRNGPAPSP